MTDAPKSPDRTVHVKDSAEGDEHENDESLATDKGPAQADAEKANADLADRTVTSPAAGRIERVFFDAGEIVSAGTPVVSILPEGALKVKFYVPETVRAGFALGDKVVVSCDGCPDGLTATLSYFASDPQFTPPVIYSRDERQRLSFLIEATLDGASLHPGQPVTVERVE